MRVVSSLFAGGKKETAPVAGTSGEEKLKPATYTWTAGSMGGGWYTQAGGMAALIKENAPEITLKVIPGWWSFKSAVGSYWSERNWLGCWLG